MPQKTVFLGFLVLLPEIMRYQIKMPQETCGTNIPLQVLLFQDEALK